MLVLVQFAKRLRILQTRSRVCFGRGDGAGLRAVALLVVLVLFAFANVTPAEAQDSPRYPSAGSTFVSVDSWVYPLFERLAGLGYVKSAMFGMKPWTRTECARLTDEAGDVLRDRLAGDGRVDELSAQMIESLEKEFAPELLVLGGGKNRSAAVESVYARVLSISGPALTDGYHFGQTIDYDFGRPNRRGTNAIAGASARATYGPLAIHVRGEFQHSPAAPTLSDAVRLIPPLRDNRAPDPPQPFARINKGRLLDTYALLNWRNWQISFGKQTFSWQVGKGGSLLLSNNANPLYAARVTRAIPTSMKWLGPVRTEIFFSRLQGHRVFAGPLIYGLKMSARPTPNLELGYGRTSLLGGGDRPVTFRDFLHSFFGIKRPLATPLPDGSANFRVGDSRNSLDWSYRIPGFRRLVFYGELYADDDEAGFMNPPKSVYRPGIRLVGLPDLPGIEVGMEAANSESPGREQHRGSLNYWNPEFPFGYTNNEFLMGNTVGRHGQTIQAWLSYRFSAEHSL